MGLAYNPDGHGKNVIRAAAGILFTPLLGETFSQNIMNSPDVPFRVTLAKADAATLNLHFPVYNEDFLPLVKSGQAAASYQVINPGITAPYSLDTYLGYQRALPSSMVLESGFVFNHGMKFVMQRNYNLPDRVTGVLPNPKVSSSVYIDNSDNSHYLSWQSSLRKRFSHGLSGNIAYTWGKVISYGTGDILSNPSDVQNFFNIRAARGPATGDRTHSFVGDFVYELPKAKGLSNAFARQVLGGWQISSIFSTGTGIPLSITESSALDPSRPDATGLPPVNTNYRQTLQYLNLAAFLSVPVSKASGGPSRPGTLGRAAVRGPGYVNLDFSFGKYFSITEKLRFQLRADMFNALNHTNFGNVVVDITKSNFGQLTSAGARQIQLNGRLTF